MVNSGGINVLKGLRFFPSSFLPSLAHLLVLVGWFPLKSQDGRHCAKDCSQVAAGRGKQGKK